LSGKPVNAREFKDASEKSWEMGKVRELSGKNSVMENYCCNFVAIPRCS